MKTYLLTKWQGLAALFKDARVKKAILKRLADALEKMGIGCGVVGIFQGYASGVYIGVVCMSLSFLLSIMEARL